MVVFAQKAQNQHGQITCLGGTQGTCSSQQCIGSHKSTDYAHNAVQTEFSFVVFHLSSTTFPGVCQLSLQFLIIAHLILQIHMKNH